MRNRLVRQVKQSQLDYAVVLAQDAGDCPDGSRDDAATHFFFSSSSRHTRFSRDWSSDVCSSDLGCADRNDAVAIRGRASSKTHAVLALPLQSVMMKVMRWGSEEGTRCSSSRRCTSCRCSPWSPYS